MSRSSPKNLLAVLTLLLISCAPLQLEPPSSPAAPQPPAPEVVTEPAATAKTSYDPSADGFVVHEWGTLTSVHGSDGALLPGLHHEEEDLPPFVADRMAQGAANPGTAVNQKMETPVTYFYSPKPLTVTAAVSFPKGILTQWFPYVRSMQPRLGERDGKLIDPWLQAGLDQSTWCTDLHAKEFSNGRLDWGNVEVMAPHEPAVLPGPLGKTSWGFARNTASNPLRLVSPDGASTQTEKFLFYRGLGSFDLPLRPTFSSGGAATFTNLEPRAAMGGLLLMVVTKSAAGFKLLGDLAPGAQLSSALPEANLSHQAFVAALKEQLSARLVRDGLYSDEAKAMVDTWERSYFLTPGVRLLYLLPQANTEAIIPLEITPAPQRTVRAMVIRLELLTSEQEKTYAGWLGSLANGKEEEKAAAKNAFLSLGRFAEPHLTRAVTLAGSSAEKAAGTGLLTEIRGTRRWAPTASE